MPKAINVKTFEKFVITLKSSVTIVYISLGGSSYICLGRAENPINTKLEIKTFSM